MTPDQRALLERVNVEVNAIPYTAVPGPDEPEDYTIDDPEPGYSWVCRDYTQDKAKLLRLAGIPWQWLCTIVTWTEPCVPEGPQNPEGRIRHEVLGVKLDTGELWILDSRPDPDMWQAQQGVAVDPVKNYRWDLQQVAGTRGWRDASGGLV